MVQDVGSFLMQEFCQYYLEIAGACIFYIASCFALTGKREFCVFIPESKKKFVWYYLNDNDYDKYNPVNQYGSELKSIQHQFLPIN